MLAVAVHASHTRKARKPTAPQTSLSVVAELRCLGGCQCTAAPRAPTALSAVCAFVEADFPGQGPGAGSSAAEHFAR